MHGQAKAPAQLARELARARGVFMRRAIGVKGTPTTSASGCHWAMRSATSGQRALPSARITPCGVALRVMRLPVATPVRLRPKSKAMKDTAEVATGEEAPPLMRGLRRA